MSPGLPALGTFMSPGLPALVARARRFRCGIIIIVEILNGMICRYDIYF